MWNQELANHPGHTLCKDFLNSMAAHQELQQVRGHMQTQEKPKEDVKTQDEGVMRTPHVSNLKDVVWNET